VMKLDGNKWIIVRYTSTIYLLILIGLGKL
jgi:hypothetical protein